MPTPIAPLPSIAEKWISRPRYLRWLDAFTAWIFLLGVVTEMLPEQPGRIVALLSAALLVLGVLLRPLRIRWRPVSGWVGLAASRSLRPGARAWYVRDGRADAVLVTARRGLRLSIAEPGFGEAETMSVRRTRVFLIPFEDQRRG